MKESFFFADLSLSEIDLDDRFRITTDVDKDDEVLLSSVSRVGVLHPPIVRMLANGGFHPVAGFRRLEAAMRLGARSVSCRVVGEETGDLVCMKLAVSDNIAVRVLNPMEKALAASKLYPLLGNDPHAVCETLSGLGCPLDISMFEKLMALCALPEAVQEGVACGWISLSVAMELAGMRQEDSLAVAETFRLLRPGLNRQRSILELSREIAARDGIAISHLLSDDPAIVEITENESLDRGLKTSRLLERLSAMRYPAITRAYERYRRLEKRLVLGPKARLVPPENFESEEFSLLLKFSRQEHLSEYAGLLSRLSISKEMEEILGIGSRIDENGT